VRYLGQGHEVETPIDGIELDGAFGGMSKLQLTELPPQEGSADSALIRRRQVHLLGEDRDCGIYDRAKLGAGATIPGPAIVEEPAHRTIVFPGDELTVDRVGNLIITAGA
jgi:N-methylhydantoinase A